MIQILMTVLRILIKQSVKNQKLDEGFGWINESVNSDRINVFNYDLLAGRSYFQLPKE